MECLKMCCKNYMVKNKEAPEKQVIKVKMPAPGDVSSSRDPRRGVGVSEDYLLSKMPPDGKEVPFVLPTFQPTYIQPPRAAKYPQSSAMSRYAERKAELAGPGPAPGSGPGYGSTESAFHPDQKAQFISPGSARRDTLQQSGAGAEARAAETQHLHDGPVQPSGPYAESIGLSGDEYDQGKVCVRLSYQETLEQVWICLVQCSDLSLPVDGSDPQKIRFKGIITTGKPVQFKSSIKDYVPDVVFMETFVFALRLQKLQGSSLVLRLQALGPRKRSVAQCVCHAELHVATCFQAVSGRVQLQVIAAQNLPASSAPLSKVFFVKAELQRLERPTTTKKTKALKASDGACQWAETFQFLLPALDHTPTLSIKLYSRSSVRRKRFLGEVVLGFDSPFPEAAEQWKNTLAQPEISVAAWHRLSKC
ncbi:hypothetical protein CRUP_004575 [Coryphaenoides rupestris]|nr:hypothetical protein CRUP_004575 [Coryphaenoides rupestris]